MMQLYSYFRSSASFRVRIALNLKGLTYEYVPVHLLKNGGEQYTPEFRKISPDSLVPALVDEGQVLNQSLAIIEYLDETHPNPPLLPADPAERARVRSLALTVACEVHPLNNVRVLRYLKDHFDVPEDKRNAWVRHWIESGIGVIETQLTRSSQTGRFCHGDTPTLADLFLIPQLFNGKRFQCDFSGMPTVMRIHDHCMALEAFQKAEWSAQPDAE